MELTLEQKKILEVEPHSFQVMKITAFAGTGKTTTLVEYAKKYSKTKFLYLAFNTNTVKDATSVFPKNVTCKTIHSLAHERENPFISRKTIQNYLSYRQLMKITNVDDKRILGYCKKILGKYCSSEDDIISEKNIPLDILGKIHLHSEMNDEDPVSNIEQCIATVSRLWEVLISDEPTDIIHDIYLKKYALSNDYFLPFDIIMLDEAQDHNPVTVDLIKKFNKPSIIVGDSYQRVYSFRGARDAMNAFIADKEFYLTGCFRFGPSIAEIANSVLSNLLHEKMSLQGLANEQGPIKDTCYIARTNAELLDKLIEWGDKPFRLVGNIGNYEFEKLLDIYNLWKNHKNKVKSEEIREFNSFEEAEKYAEELDEVVLKRNCLFVRKYQDRLPGFIESIYRNIKKQNINADTVFSTCHKAKGKEFDKVVVLDDFKYSYTKETTGWRPKTSLADDESHLIYVAITRAKKEVVIPDTLSQILTYLENSKEGKVTEVESTESTVPKTKVVKVVKKKVVKKPKTKKTFVALLEKPKEQETHRFPETLKKFIEGPLGEDPWDVTDAEIYFDQYDDFNVVYQEDKISEIEGWGESLDDQDSDYWEYYFAVEPEWTR